MCTIKSLSIKITFLLLICLSNNGGLIRAQDIAWQPLTREVSVSDGDTIVKARIYIKNPEVSIENTKHYYWHYKGVINNNMGGYAGELLHGKYLVFTAEKSMVSEGEFESGLKIGVWKYWYRNGNLRRVENWKKGVLDGECQIYGESGELLNNLKYQNGELKENDRNGFSIQNLRQHEVEEEPDVEESEGDPVYDEPASDEPSMEEPMLEELPPAPTQEMPDTNTVRLRRRGRR